MIAAVAVMAERAESREDGKLDLYGIHNCRYVESFPAKLSLTLAIRFDIEPLDFGVVQNIAVRVVDEDHAELVALRASPLNFGSNHPPGQPLAYDMIVPITFGFPREGTFTFEIRVNDRTVARVPLRVEITPAR